METVKNIEVKDLVLDLSHILCNYDGDDPDFALKMLHALVVIEKSRKEGEELEREMEAQLKFRHFFNNGPYLIS
jgi:hypothetical protein